MKSEQFLSFKNNWHELTIKNIIRKTAIHDGDAVYFPTPHTVATVEGYIEGEGSTEYEAHEIVEGNTITYLDEDHLVMHVEGDRFRAVPTENTHTFSREEALDDERIRAEDSYEEAESFLWRLLHSTHPFQGWRS